MGSRKMKKKKSRITMAGRGWLLSRLSPFKNKRSCNKASPPTSKDKRMNLELKDMKKLSSNDETFHLSWEVITDIILIIRSLTTPTPEEYMQWDEYAISFYLKMCTCHGVDYQHLEATSEDDCVNKPPLSSTSFKQQEEHTESSGVNQPSKEEHLKKEEHPECSGANQPSKEDHFKKEAVDIMMRPDWKNNTNDLIDLANVEGKIYFFCNYFQSHLPTCWDYKRDDAKYVVASYDPTRKPRYKMAGYFPFPFKDLDVQFEYHEWSRLSRKEMANIMSIIHSRRTPDFWDMCSGISFYCKLCSCFGIDYHRLEAAAEDDVCLMNVGS